MPKIKTGGTYYSKSGRQLTPAPTIDCTSDRKAANSIKRMHQWLKENAIEELRLEGNEFGMRQIEQIDPNKSTTADVDLMHAVLFPPED